MRPQPWPEPSEEIAVAVRAMYSGRELPLPVAIRDQLGEVFTDEAFGAGFAARGKPGWSPGRLALVTVLQMAENLTDRQPPDVHTAQHAARAAPDTTSWQATYALRAGVEGTIHQAVTVCDTRHARYRGLRKVHLQQVFSAVALNLIRLHASWNAHPMDHTRTSHLTRLELALTA